MFAVGGSWFLWTYLSPLHIFSSFVYCLLPLLWWIKISTGQITTKERNVWAKPILLGKLCNVFWAEGTIVAIVALRDIGNWACWRRCVNIARVSVCLWQKNQSHVTWHDFNFQPIAFWDFNLWCDPENEPGLRVTDHRVSDFGRVGSGRVTGQCVRPGAWPGFEFYLARLSWRCFYRVTPSRQTIIFAVSVSVCFRHCTTGLLISVNARNIYLLTCWLSFWRHDVSRFDVI